MIQLNESSIYLDVALVLWATDLVGAEEWVDAEVELEASNCSFSSLYFTKPTSSPCLYWSSWAVGALARGYLVLTSGYPVVMWTGPVSPRLL